MAFCEVQNLFGTGVNVCEMMINLIHIYLILNVESLKFLMEHK